jgi:hypothetical protein
MMPGGTSGRPQGSAPCNSNVRLHAPTSVGRGNASRRHRGSAVQDAVVLPLVNQAEPAGFVDRYTKRPESAKESRIWAPNFVFRVNYWT